MGQYLPIVALALLAIVFAALSRVASQLLAPSATTMMSASKAPASVTARLADGSMARTVVWKILTPGFTTSRYGWRTDAGG